MSQQPTLFSFFSRTPKTPTSSDTTERSSNTNGTPTTGRSDSTPKSLRNVKDKDDKSSPSPRSNSKVSTPVSRTSNGTKRRRLSDVQPSSRKKSRKEEGETRNDSDEEMDVEENNAPSRRSRGAKKHKRILAISSGSDSEENNVGTKSKADRNGKKTVGKDDDDYSPTKHGSAEESDNESEMSAVDSEEEEISEASGNDSDSGDRRKSGRGSAKAASKKKTKAASATKSNGKNGSLNASEIKNRLQKFNSSECASPKPAPITSTVAEKEDSKWTHLKLEWAQEDQRMDAKKRKPTDPEYDGRTLYVPSTFLHSLTPAMRQWWEMKSKYFDTILFFKVGKFYEFYHWDACVAAKELGILYMKGEHAHSGFPEISFSRFANALMEKGYKIARIEQTETPDMLAERIRKTKPEKHEKVIKREICQMSTKGVRYASFQDEAISNPFSPESLYLYAISEKPTSSGNENQLVFGVCFVDTTIGTFHIGQFVDDRHASRLRTLLSHYVPAQILHERGKLSTSLQQIFHNMPGVRKDALLPDSEFWNAKKTLKYLAEQDYFRDSNSGSPTWPTTLQPVLSKTDGLGLSADNDYEIGVKCLGGVIWYLKHCLLDHDLLSQQRFEIYEPIDNNTNNGDAPANITIPQRCLGPKHMVLDGITIRNLDILDGQASLLSTLDKCGTNFGKRLLRHWVCLPLAHTEEICERQDAVDELMNLRECRGKIIPLMKSLPDLERLLSKIHYLGSAHRSKNHPDGRAFFFEDVKYSKNKITDLLSTLRGFKTCSKIIQELKNVEEGVDSKPLKMLLEKFPSHNLDKLLTKFDNMFDHQAAAKEGKIKPKLGADKEYDDAMQAVNDIDNDAQEYLREVSKQLKTRVVYFGSDKKRFQLEVAESVKVSREFEMSSGRKGFKRYYNETTKGFLSSMLKAEAEKDEVLRDIARKIFAKFDESREAWSVAVECIASLDVLISLALFSESQEVMCRPSVSFSTQPFLSIVEGRHPCVASDAYIPNDTFMGSNGDNESNKNFVILTGPNMGGKSTLMRQVGLITVLAHLGCHVPAEKCELSVVDRIFTRLGANDNIGEGESTFYVEMSETSAILKHATSSSLLLIDELGRGTATYDGTAIAYAVAKELSERKCRSLFSTHYHTLVESLQAMPFIQMSHMACMVENENENDPTQESITFLYKIVSGPCPKSYGFNAARLAGISDEVIRVGHKKAKELESLVGEVRTFTDVCSSIQRKTFSLKDFACLRI